MSIIDVFNTKGDKVSQLELADGIFNVPVKQSVLHEVVTMQLACRRAGTASVKNRGDVKGSTRKLYKQKGTGRARRGDIKSPLLRGGGSIFGPNPRSYSYKVPKKVRKQALKMALTCKNQENNILILDKFELEEAKTKGFVSVLGNLQVKKALIVTEVKNENLEIASRNVSDIKVMRCEGLNVYDILKYEKLILLEPSIKSIEGRLLV
jgi:large subunit ribosomal protein L4